MLKDFGEYETSVRAQGFDEVLKRNWAAGKVTPNHVHPFDASGLVVDGEMWLTIGDETRHLVPGDTFEVPRNTTHAERYGGEGTNLFVARRHSA